MDNRNKNLSDDTQKDILEPIILGTVKKGNTGKPLVAIIILLFIGITLYFLPLIDEYFGDYSILDLIKQGELINFIKNKGKKEQNVPVKDAFVLVGNNEEINNGFLIISNLQIKDNVISYDIKSKNATYDATKENLYLQIYVDKENLVYTKAIDDVFTIDIRSVKENVSFYKASDTYYAKLVRINDQDIEDVTLSSDESGLASIVCSKANDQYEYIFNNKELISIKRTYQYKYNVDALQDYQKAFNTYSDLKNEREKYQIITNISEDNVGFIYTEEINSETADVSSLGNNYYPYKYAAKVILFKQEAKGFDCE